MPEIQEAITWDSVLETVPVGRRAYLIAANEMGKPELVQDKRRRITYTRASLGGLYRAAHVLVESSKKEELVPPLPDNLLAIIEGIDDSYDLLTSDQISGQFRHAAELAIRAAIDHGNQPEPFGA